MTPTETGDPGQHIELEYEIDEPPHKVWHAITVPELRERWLPNEALADPDPASSTPGREVRYRLRDSDPPFLESLVTFRIVPNTTGGTSLRIVQELADARLRRMIAAANNDGTPLMLAA